MRETIHRRLWSRLFCLLICDLFVAATTTNPQVEFRIRNDGRIRAQVDWIDPRTKKLYPIGTLEPLGYLHLNSFLGHEFQVLELPNPTSGHCHLVETVKSLDQMEGCGVTTFQVTKSYSNNLVVTEKLEIREESFAPSSSTKLSTSEFLNICRFEAKKKLLKIQNGGTDYNAMKNRIIHQLGDCLSHGLVPKIMEMKQELEFEYRVLRTVSRLQENFTCTNDLAESTPDLEQRQWTSDRDHVTRKVHVKFDLPVAKIHVVEDFASLEECNAMEQSVVGKLGIATTEDGKGGSRVNENRKAMQAYIEPDWSQESLGDDPILRLNRRIFDYTNHVLGLNISVLGQEPLMSIQYLGRGLNDTQPDRYTSHCDGKCDGDPLSHASRMATMVIYCTVPEKGGHTNFRNAGVTVKPKVGSGLFFSYINPSSNITDRGYTTHSGCPVFQGEKKIITQWIRLGVTDEVPYEAYNSLDVLIDEDGE